MRSIASSLLGFSRGNGFHRGRRLLPGIAVWIAAGPASAHFVWARIERAPDPRVEVTFGEQPDEPTTAVPLARLQSTRAWDAARKPLPLASDESTWKAEISAATRTVGASVSWGIVDREGDGTGAFLLEYYAKAAATVEDAQDAVGLPFEVFARRDGKAIVASVRRGETALEGATVHVQLPSGRTAELRSDAKGEARIDDLQSGLYGIRARWLEDRKGEVGGKPYGEVRHYCTLTFFGSEDGRGEIRGAVAADPEAYALLKGAHDSRQVMPPDFPGFRCNLVLTDGDETFQGTLIYRRRQDPTIEIDHLDADRLAWVRRQILNVVGHRRGGDFAEGDGRYPLELAREEDNAFGRLIQVHDATDSSYRVREEKVREVTRTMDGSRFTISVIDTMEADAGKYLANHFLVSYRDPASGALQKIEGYRDSYARVEGVWLPTSRTVVTIAGETTPNVRSIRLSKHQQLPVHKTTER